MKKAFLPITGLCLFAVAFNRSLLKKHYIIKSTKLKGKIKIIQISDLHGCVYGENQQNIIDVLEEESPDFIVMSGDILDDKMKEDGVFTLLGRIGSVYKCFYSVGNHEIWTGKEERVKNYFEKYGVKVLAGNKAELKVNGNVIDIFGVDDPEAGEDEFYRQYIDVIKNTDKDRFSVLISHRPELIDFYDGFKGDIIFSGHAHGGQWRIPFVLNGLYAPNQGLFPKYAGGLYKLKNCKMVVSRGLSRENTVVPRIFNRPEIVIVTVVGNKK